MPILSEARYENKMLKPERELPLREGESVIIEIKRPVTDQMYGILSTDKKTADTILEMEGLD
ncbi:antitoxin family protein [Methanoregula sp.]|jgi:predicted DNA-binding antitoxin AbrB/MazE fold protein|uniref:antitoxin family protein n=1 Tax=Methanoregula sp. TaxID=2052170 RepID=UPI003C2A08F9